MTTATADVKPSKKTPVAVAPELLATCPELNEGQAQELFTGLRNENWEYRNLSAKKHASSAKFRRLALQLCEGKGYRFIPNDKTGKPFTNMEELGWCAFGIKRIMMQKYVRAAKIERGMYTKAVTLYTLGPDAPPASTQYRYTIDETPTEYVLNTLQKLIRNEDAKQEAQDRVKVYFHAKHHAHDIVKGYSGKTYPTAKDIIRAACEYGFAVAPDTIVEEDNIELYPDATPAPPSDLDTDAWKAQIDAADAATLERWKAMIEARLSAPQAAPRPRTRQQTTVQDDTALSVGSRIYKNGRTCVIKSADAGDGIVSFYIEGEPSGQVYPVSRYTFDGYTAEVLV